MFGLRPNRGYTYFGVLFVVMLVGLALTGAAAVTEVQQQRLKEQQLLYVGKQYLAAIGSYYNAAPGGAKQYPPELADLLRDPRYPTVYSRARGVPLKRRGFGSAELDRDFADRKSYAQWKFIYRDGLTTAELLADDRHEAGPAARNRSAQQ